MINKIFNSDSTDNRVLEVGRNGELLWMNIRDGATGDKMFRIKLEDMPEILRSLADVTAGAKAEIEARERAELEAEALEEAADEIERLENIGDTAQGELNEEQTAEYWLYHGTPKTTWLRDRAAQIRSGS